MSRTSRRWLWIGSALVALGIAALNTPAAGQSGAVDHLTTPLFTVRPGETADFNVSLDDVDGAPPVVVYLEFLDRSGNTVRGQTVTLAAGKTVTLKLRTAGQFRTHAEVVDNGGLSARRAVVGQVEIGDFTTGTGCIRGVPSVRNPIDHGPQ
ncbi:MAG: hypothetical protein AB7O28_14165 [Vicinamibacterales bacterium]